MGTDIHFYVQRRGPEGWEFPEPPRSLMSEFDVEWEQDHGHEPWYRRRWYSGRNYDLFAILANVRNGRGFADVDTGDGFRTMTSSLRGLPEDFEITDWIREHDDPEHCHSHNWVSLREVLDFPWTELETNHRGWVGEREFLEWLESGGTGGPSSWSGGISGYGVRHVDVATMTRIVRGDQPREEGVEYCCHLEWGETYHDSCRYFCETVVPALEEMAGGRPEDVRLVFWFDS